MLRRLASVIAPLLLCLIFLRECVGIVGDIDYAREQYRKAGDFGGVMEFILNPPPGAAGHDSNCAYYCGSPVGVY